MSERPPKKRNGARKVPACPICGRPRVHEYRPFCSARCRDVDLGRWFQQVYTIPATEADESAADGEAEEDGASS